MRLRFLLLSSVISSIIGAGISFATGRFLDSHWAQLILPTLFQRRLGVAIVLAPLLLVAVLTSVIVYRHTSRVRRTQAVLAAVIVIVLSLLACYLIGWFFPPRPLHY